MRQESRGNPRARILYDQTSAAVVSRFYSHCHLPTRGRKLDRIREKVPRNLMQSVCVALHEKLRAFPFSDELDFLCGCRWTNDIHRSFRDFDKIYRHNLEAH